MWTADAADAAEGRLESEQGVRHAIGIGLIDARVRLPSSATRLAYGIRPTFSVEESRRPRELASIHV